MTRGGVGRLRSVRVRTTFGACLVVGCALVLASVALVVFLGRSLTAGVRDAADARAEVVATAIGAGAEPGLVVGGSDEEIVQVLGADGAVEAASANVMGEPALASLGPGGEATIDVEFEDGPFLVVATGVPGAVPPRVVLVGRSLEDVVEATDAEVPLLVSGVPLLVLVVGVVTWKITGGALRPVEAIRAEVETLSAGALDRRVPEPDTGDEIARLATTMNRMLARLESSHLRQRRFVSDAAHELRSPVASIRQHSEVAIAHPQATSVGDLAEVVHRENLRVEHLVNDLLLLARVDEGRRGGTDQVDLDDVVLAEVERLRRSTPLWVDTSRVSAARVLGDAGELERVVRNLAENAANHARGVVALSVAEVGGRAVVTIDDDGPGIEPSEREHVFDRFVRLDDARSRDRGGSGLGLAIVRAVVEAHGGEVSIGEGPLGGARVEVSLPIGGS